MSVGTPKKISPVLLRLMWRTGLATMSLQAVYTLLVFFSGDILRVHHVFFGGMDLTWPLATMFFAIGVAEFLIKPKTARAIAITVVIYYLATAVFSLFVASNEVIKVILWLILLSATAIMLSRKALVAGSIVGFIVATSDWLITDPSFAAAITTSISAILAIATAFYTSYLRESGVVRLDVYEQLKNRERVQEQRLETIVNSLNDAILNIDSRGDIRLYNAATLNLFDTNDNLNGLGVDKVFKLSDEEGNSVLLGKLVRDARKSIEREDLVHTYPDGQKINLFLSITPVRGSFKAGGDGAQVGGVIVIARDITKQKSLDDERDEFISVVSHELRTPVAIAEGTLSNLQFLIAKGADVKTFSTTLGAAHDQILYLGQMVNDLSTLSRAQRGVYMDLEDINVKDFATSLYNKYLPEAKQRHLTLDLDVRAQGAISVPRMAIEEMMQNFITNALKYTREGGVTISVHRAQTDDGEPGVEFAIRDTGIGISMSDQKHVFQRFWRSEDFRTRETNGTGLGLHVVEQLAAKIGTKIEIKSRINHGSTFSFRLPLLKK